MYVLRYPLIICAGYGYRYPTATSGTGMHPGSGLRDPTSNVQVERNHMFATPRVPFEMQRRRTQERPFCISLKSLRSTVLKIVSITTSFDDSLFIGQASLTITMRGVVLTLLFVVAPLPLLQMVHVSVMAFSHQEYDSSRAAISIKDGANRRGRIVPPMLRSATDPQPASHTVASCVRSICWNWKRDLEDQTH